MTIVNPDAAIDFRAIGKVFSSDEKSVTALKDITATVPAGTFVSIVGPSGCGKSTLLALAAGLDTATSGEVYVSGSPVRGPRHDVGFVFQEDSTLPWRSALDNVTFGLQVRGVPRKRREEIGREMLALVGLSQFASQTPRKLSGGMRQRLAIARTLALGPDTLLMDEPFGALDHQTRLFLGGELLRIWSETDAAVLFVTHDIDEAVLLANEVWVMSYRPGRIVDRVPVPFDYPRDLNIIASPEFGELTGRIWGTLEEESRAGYQAENAYEASSFPGTDRR